MHERKKSPDEKIQVPTKNSADEKIHTYDKLPGEKMPDEKNVGRKKARR